MKSKGKLKTRLAAALLAGLLLTGCGPERPPVYPSWTQPGETAPSAEAPVKPVTDVASADSYNFNGNSLEIDVRPCEGVHITAEKDAFWEDPSIRFEPVSDKTPNVMEIDQKLFSDGYLMMDAWEADFGLADDEMIPGEYNVEIDLSKTHIDPRFYEAVAVARVGDGGDYYILNSRIENGILTFSAQQNSILTTVIVTGLLTSLGLSVYQTIESNWYYLINITKQDFVEIAGRNDYGKYRIQWMSEDIDLRHDKKWDEIYAGIGKYWDEALQYRKSLSWYERLNENEATIIYFISAIEADTALYELCREKIFELPEVIDKTRQLIDKAYRYLAEEEDMRMPTHEVSFKNIGGLGAEKLAEAVNKQFINSYIQFDLFSTVISGYSEDNDPYGDFLLTLTHELFHICQNKYRLPIDVLTDAARYDEMAAVYIETKAYEWYAEHEDCKKVENKKLTPNNFWGRMRLPINGEEDKLIGDSDARQTAKGESGYTLSGMLLYIVDKVSSRSEVTGHKLMKARSYFYETGITKPIASVLGIPEEEVNTHFKSYFVAKRYEMGSAYMTEYKKDLYGMPKMAEIRRGGKTHADLDAAKGGYYITLRGFRYNSLEKGPTLVALDSNIRKVFPDVSISPGISYSTFSKGAYIRELKQEDGFLLLPMVEIHGKDDANIQEKIGYTVYPLDQTGKPELSENEEGDLVVKMPKNSTAAQDKVIEGYLLTIRTANLEVLEVEIPPDKFEQEIIIDKKDLYKDRDLSEELSLIATLCEYVKGSESKKLMGIESEPVIYLMHHQSDLSRFTGCWIPLSDKEPNGQSYVIGLAYLEPDEEHPAGEFGYFESQLDYWTAKGRWSEITEFDYDETSGVLTIVFDRGPATFRINENGTMTMSNYGGSWDFYKRTDD